MFFVEGTSAADMKFIFVIFNWFYFDGFDGLEGDLVAYFNETLILSHFL
jgi:hypothetical protein